MAFYARRGHLRDERDGMSVAELQELEEVKLLITKGQANGVLTYAEVATALAEVDLDESDIEDLHGFLERSEIELVEEIDQPQVPAAQAEAERETGGRRRPRLSGARSSSLRGKVGSSSTSSISERSR